MVKNELYKDTDESSFKFKEDAVDLQERNIIIQILMKFHFQKNVICFTLKNISSVDKKIMKQIKMMLKLRHLKMELFQNQSHWDICRVHIIVYLSGVW